MSLEKITTPPFRHISSIGYDFFRSPGFEQNELNLEYFFTLKQIFEFKSQYNHLTSNSDSLKGFSANVDFSYDSV